MGGLKPDHETSWNAALLKLPRAPNSEPAHPGRIRNMALQFCGAAALRKRWSLMMGSTEQPRHRSPNDNEAFREALLMLVRLLARQTVRELSEEPCKLKQGER
jgi:hypothetical protein